MRQEFAEIEYRETGSRIVCPCGTRNQSMYLRCLASGVNDLLGPCLKCWTCGRVITADGAVLRQVEVTS